MSESIQPAASEVMTMSQQTIQVEAQVHYKRSYLTLPRIITHWHQASEVASATPAAGEILEIGPGSGHTSWMLREWGYPVTTMDFDPRVSPNVVADVTQLPFTGSAFDCVLAAQVLEHLPFEQFGRALKELKRVSRSSVIVTLPAPFLGLSALFNLPRFEPKGVFLGVPYAVRHRFNGEHYWEVGKLGYGLRQIKRRIRESGLEIVKAFRPAPSLYCYFFVCKVLRHSGEASARPEHRLRDHAVRGTWQA